MSVDDNIEDRLMEDWEICECAIGIVVLHHIISIGNHRCHYLFTYSIILVIRATLVNSIFFISSDKINLKMSEFLLYVNTVVNRPLYFWNWHMGISIKWILTVLKTIAFNTHFCETPQNIPTSGRLVCVRLSPCISVSVCVVICPDRLHILCETLRKWL